MKYILSIFLCLLVVSAQSAEILRAITFTDGQRISAAQLNGLIDNALISTSFYTDKASESTLNGADQFLVFSSAQNAYKQISANSALYNNTAFITTQPEKLVPVGADYMLLWDSVANVLSKVSIANVTTQGTNSISSLKTLDVPFTTGFTFPVFSGLTNYQATILNIYTNVPPSSQIFTNLLQPLALGVTNNDGVAAFSALNGTNMFYTFAGLITNSPDYKSLTNPTDVLWGFSPTNNRIFKVSYQELQVHLVGQKFTTNMGTLAAIGIGGAGNGGLVFTVPTGFADVASYVKICIRCNTADQGYIVGDEVDVHDISGVATDNAQHFTVGTATNTVFLVGNSNAPKFNNKTNNAVVSLTSSAWNYKVYATH